MKVYLQKMIRASVIFILFYILQATLFSIIYSHFSTLTYIEILPFELAIIKNYEIEMNLFVAGANAVQNLIYAVIVAIFATYTYVCYVNRPPKILFPSKLVIRHKSNGKLCFGVIIGNKNKYALNDVMCTLTFTYRKASGGMNGETKMSDTHTNIINYYRFSFEIKGVPVELMKAYINKEPINIQKDEILVTFSGVGYANNKFYRKKVYKLSDIIIDEHEPKPKEAVINPFTNKLIKEKMNWNELYREEEVGELERNNIINEICEIFNLSL